MNIILKHVKSALLSLLLGVTASAHASAAQSSEDKVCAPFKDSQIDGSILASMLQAADEGKLYRIKPDSSKMGFCVNSPLGKVEADFMDFKGGLALSDTDGQSMAMVKIEVDSLETDSGMIEAMLKSKSFFDPEQYPNILFVSTGFEWMTDKKAILKGELTMHGITKPVAFYVDIKKAESEIGALPGEETLTVKATTTIQRSEFGMHTLSPVVDDRVSLCMTIDAYKHQSGMVTSQR